MNRKRVQRLWREEGLRVPLKRRKRQRLGHSAQPARRLSAEQPNHVWALDFQFDQTADGRVLKLLNIVDEHTREALAIVAARRINANATAATLDRIVARRGTAPGYIRCDNGPELTANALRDWCRFSGTASSYIEPGAPWENPFVESFNGRLRDEFLAVEQFDSLLEAQVLIEDWRIEYNTKRPHSSLGWLAPAAYAERWEAQPLISGGLAIGVRSSQRESGQYHCERELSGEETSDGTVVVVWGPGWPRSICQPCVAKSSSGCCISRRAAAAVVGASICTECTRYGTVRV